MRLKSIIGLQAGLFFLLGHIAMGGLIVLDSNGWKKAAKSCDAIVVGDISLFSQNSKVTNVMRKGGVEWTTTRTSVNYEFDVQEVLKGSFETGVSLKAPFVFDSKSAKVLPQPEIPKQPGVVRFTGNMSVSQMIPGSGDETRAKEGKWIIFLKNPGKGIDGFVVERVEKIARLGEVKEVLKGK